VLASIALTSTVIERIRVRVWVSMRTPRCLPILTGHSSCGDSDGKLVPPLGVRSCKPLPSLWASSLVCNSSGLNKARRLGPLGDILTAWVSFVSFLSSRSLFSRGSVTNLASDVIGQNGWLVILRSPTSLTHTYKVKPNLVKLRRQALSNHISPFQNFHHAFLSCVSILH
jgi:hypothetical protein